MSARPDLATAYPHFTRDADAGMNSYECIEAGEFQRLVQLQALAQRRIHTNPWLRSKGTIYFTRVVSRVWALEPIHGSYSSYCCTTDPDESQRKASETAQTAPTRFEAKTKHSQNKNSPRCEAVLVWTSELRQLLSLSALGTQQDCSVAL